MTAANEGDSAGGDSAGGPSHTPDIGMTNEEKRHDQLTRAPKSSEEDAAPRITTSTAENGATRIDVADTAIVRPGNPDKQHPE